MKSNGQIISIPRIDDKCHESRAITTQGEIESPADNQGESIIFFSHPADFTRCVLQSFDFR